MNATTPIDYLNPNLPPGSVGQVIQAGQNFAQSISTIAGGIEQISQQVTTQTTSDVSTLNTTLANLGMSDVRFPKPLFQGDSVKARTTVRSKRESKSRPNEGIVNFFHEMINQDGVVVATCERAALMRKRPAGAA